MKKEEKNNIKLSYESDGKMGKRDKTEGQKSQDRSADFFNITPDSE